MRSFGAAALSRNERSRPFTTRVAPTRAMIRPQFVLGSEDWFCRLLRLCKRKPVLGKLRAQRPHLVEALEGRIAPSTLLTLSAGSLSVAGDADAAGQDESL